MIFGELPPRTGYARLLRNEAAIIDMLSDVQAHNDQKNLDTIKEKYRKYRNTKKQFHNPTVKFQENGRPKLSQKKLKKLKAIDNKLKAIEADFEDTFNKQAIKLVHLEMYVEQYFFRDGKSLNSNLRYKTLHPLFENINSYLILEKNNFYPKYLLEALLWAFALKHFNAEQLNELINIMPSAVLHDETTVREYSIEEIIAYYSQLEAQNDFLLSDDIVAQIRLLPPHLITVEQYTKTASYSRKSDTFSENNGFNDCVESSIFSFLAFILFDRHKNEFILDSLMECKNALPNNIIDHHQLTHAIDYFKLFSGRNNFYSIRGKTRSLWNKAMAGIPNADYNQDFENTKNELNPGLVNILKVLYGLLNEPNDFLDSMSEAEFSEKLGAIIKKIRPDFDYTISVGSELSNFNVEVLEKRGEVKTILGTFSICSSLAHSRPRLLSPFSNNPLRRKIQNYFLEKNYDDARGLVLLDHSVRAHPFLRIYALPLAFPWAIKESATQFAFNNDLYLNNGLHKDDYRNALTVKYSESELLQKSSSSIHLREGINKEFYRHVEKYLEFVKMHFSNFENHINNNVDISSLSKFDGILPSFSEIEICDENYSNGIHKKSIRGTMDFVEGILKGQTRKLQQITSITFQIYDQVLNLLGFLPNISRIDARTSTNFLGAEFPKLRDLRLAEAGSEEIRDILTKYPQLETLNVYSLKNTEEQAELLKGELKDKYPRLQFSFDRLSFRKVN